VSAPLTPEREQEIREWVAAMGERKDIRYYGSWMQHNELLEEIDRLRDELAELRAGQDPRLRCLIVKAAKDRDLYVGWSNVCEMPAGVWTRAEALAYGFPRSRLDRADENGSSDLSCKDGWWDDAGFVAEQRGWLKRDRLGDYAQLWLADRQDEAFDLLEPFEGESEVRR